MQLPHIQSSIKKCASPIIMGSLDFALVKFAIYHGLKVTLEPIRLEAYICKRILCKIIETAMHQFTSLAFKPLQATDVLKRVCFRIIKVMTWPVRLIDELYCKALKCRSFSICEKTPAFMLTIPEIARKILLTQSMHTLACQAGKKVTELLFRIKLVTLIPCMWQIHTIQFVAGIIFKSISFNKQINREQKLYTETLFVDMREMIEEHYSHLKSFCENKHYGTDRFERQLVYLYDKKFNRSENINDKQGIKKFLTLFKYSSAKNEKLKQEERILLFHSLIKEFNRKVLSVQSNWTGRKNKEFTSLIKEQNNFYKTYQDKLSFHSYGKKQL